MSNDKVFFNYPTGVYAGVTISEIVDLMPYLQEHRINENVKIESISIYAHTCKRKNFYCVTMVLASAPASKIFVDADDVTCYGEVEYVKKGHFQTLLDECNFKFIGS